MIQPNESYSYLSPHDVSDFNMLICLIWFPGLSYLKNGWNWILSALTKNWSFLPSCSFISHIDSDPAMASRRKHHRKLFRIEFSASTLD